MTVAASTSFNLDLTEMVEEAFERCGSQLRTRYDLKTARRSLSTANQADLTITSISVSTYATIPNKLTQARPIQVWFNRQSGADYAGTATSSPPAGIDYPKIVVWPTPDQGTAGDPYYTFVYWRMRRIHDGGSGVNTMDIPFRFLPCLVAGLSYYLALKIEGAADRIQMLKAQYDEAWEFAATEDRDKSAIRFVPRQMFIY